MRAIAYALLRRHVPQYWRSQIKDVNHWIRTRMKRQRRLLHGGFTTEYLRLDLLREISDDFDVLFVHCSMDDLYPMFDGTVFDLLQMLLDYCGPDRTLAMPAFFSGGQDFNKVRHYKSSPVFDVMRTPSTAGLLTDIFRRRKGVRRSLHPTFSVCAIGPHAEELVSRHHLSPSTFGEGSPFAVMAKLNTTILGLGTRYYRVLTQVHTAWGLLGDDYPLQRSTEEVLVTIIDQHQHHFDYLLKVPQNIYPRRIERLKGMMTDGGLREWSFHGVPMFWADAGKVTQALCQAAGRGDTIFDVRNG